jgi:O-antigen ligase
MNQKIQSLFRFTPSLYFWGNVLIVSGLSISRAMLSIGQFLLIFAGILQLFQNPTAFRKILLKNKMLYIFALLFILPLLSGFYTSDIANWKSDLQIKLPFLILPFAYILQPNFNLKQWAILAFLFVIPHGLIALFSVLDYHFFHLIPQITDKNIMQSGSIKISTGIDHIYFGIFLAYSALFAMVMSFPKAFHLPALPKPYSFLMQFFALLNFILTHLLTSRNGFLTLYVGAGILILYYIIRNRKFGYGLALMALLVATPMIVQKTVPTFRARMENTYWDAEQYLRFHRLCDCSLALRFYAWEHTWGIFQQHFFLGTGIADVKKDLMESYNLNDGKLEVAADLTADELPEGPHSQYLEYLAGLGIVGFIALISTLFFPLTDKMPKNIFLYLILGGLATIMLTESFLERQWGIAFFVSFYYLARIFKQEK